MFNIPCSLGDTDYAVAMVTRLDDPAAMRCGICREKSLRQSHLTHAVEWSDSLAIGSWSSAGVSEQILSDNGTVQQVKASMPVGSIDRRFIRLKVQ